MWEVQATRPALQAITTHITPTMETKLWQTEDIFLLFTVKHNDPQMYIEICLLNMPS